ncbi:hypothetical protein JTE90_021425 [Oedothorax gibbosus]|uniref:Adenomatous polyposis coli protein n=1 Tax=Oedothorax gibbosus TaxID=931172 RepID=A0AAV6VEC2_9ARAC|nr:hypothetical protein JTE90_021425 [Oedothorax gibbosus]
MLSFKERKPKKPAYNYYVETDLDTIDDQPIDYSKRYDEQLVDDVCGSSSAKKRHHSTPSDNGIPHKIPGDELKVYCIEGTPLLISSASSLCDLNEIGPLIHASERIKKEAKKEPSESESFETKYDETQEENSKMEQTEREVDESNTQGNTSSQTDDVFSKASSPLMFSRSSSVCSLNSYEQNSIVDDRSSVSIFSNLASGLISPSEIPDSPGEAMSPFIPSKHQTEFVFPPPKSMEPVLGNLQMNPSPPFIDEDVPEDNMKVYNDEGDGCSVSNLSELSIEPGSSNGVFKGSFPVIEQQRRNSLPVHKQQSPITVNCVMVNEHHSSMRMNSVPVIEHQSSSRITSSPVGNQQSSMRMNNVTVNVQQNSMRMNSVPVNEHQSSKIISTSPEVDQQSSMNKSSFPVSNPRSFPVVKGGMEMDHTKGNENLGRIPRPTKSVAEKFLGFATIDQSIARDQDKGTKYSWTTKDEDDQDEKINFSRLSEDDAEDQENINNFSRLSEGDDEDHDAKVSFSGRMKVDNDHQDEKTNFSRLSEDEENQDEKINFSRLTEDDDEDQDEKMNFTRLTEDEEDSKNGEDFSFEDSFEQCSSSYKKLSEDSMPENESPDYLKDYSDEDSDALLGACIQNGMPSASSLYPKQPLISSCHGSQEIKTKEEVNYIVSYSNCETSDSEDEDLQNCIRMGLPQNPNKSKDSNNQIKSSNSAQNNPQEMDVAEASDEDDYAVLQHIIDFGKPKSDPKLPYTNGSKVSNPYPSGYRSRNFPQKMDALEASDEEEYKVMQQHMKLNRPNGGPQPTYSNNVNGSNNYSSFKNQIGAKDREVADGSDDEGDELLQNIIDFGKPKISLNVSSHSNTNASSSYSAGHRRLPVPQEMDVLEASDEEDYSPMLQTIIEFGKPKSASLNTMNASHSYSHFRSQGYRDKQPDGSSDDDQDILAQLIQTGMPKPRQPYPLPTRPSSHKPQPSRQPQTRDYRTPHFEPPHAFRKSPTTDYRTLYTKANQQRKSPTKITNNPLRSSNATKDKRTTPPQTYCRQRQQHKRSPTPEERAMLLSSFAARRCTGSVTLPNNMVQYRTSTERTFYNPPNQIRKPESYQNPTNQIRRTENYQFPVNQTRKTESYQSPMYQKKRSESNQIPMHQMGKAESYHSKYHRWINGFREPKIEPSSTPDVTCTYRTEDTPILSPSASISDLSTLSFPEDRIFFDRSRNNSQNSDSSSDDELLRQCIRAGMPSEKRALR